MPAMGSQADARLRASLGGKRTLADSPLRCYSGSMRHIVTATAVAALTACTTTAGQQIVPTRSTVARIESGYQLVRDLGSVGAYADPAEMNRESRVRVRAVACTNPAAGTAICKYETNRCSIRETDADGDGWCPRTSKFVRLKYPRGIFDVIVAGWTLEQPPSTE